MFLNPIPKEYYPFISDYVKILVPSFITYLVTKYTFTRQRKYDIKEKQFNQVYLPLYMLNESITPDISSEDLCLYIKKVDKLFYKNYQYVYPKTLEKFKILKERKKPSSIYLFQSQATFDYEYLKKELGYPTNSFFALYQRLNRKMKLLYCLFLAFIPIDIFLLVGAFTLILYGDLINGLSALLIFVVLLSVLYILNLVIKI